LGACPDGQVRPCALVHSRGCERAQGRKVSASPIQSRFNPASTPPSTTARHGETVLLAGSLPSTCVQAPATPARPEPGVVRRRAQPVSQTPPAMSATIDSAANGGRPAAVQLHLGACPAPASAHCPFKLMERHPHNGVRTVRHRVSRARRPRQWLRGSSRSGHAELGRRAR
jgi:hypothetical protein